MTAAVATKLDPASWLSGAKEALAAVEALYNDGLASVRARVAKDGKLSNELIEAGKVRPVLWRTLGFDQVAEAHQLMYKNQHLGKISILVGAETEGLGKTADGPGAIRAEVGA